MKATFLFLIVCALCTMTNAVRNAEDSPLSATNDIAMVLANEPVAAQSRFAEARTATPDVISFRDDSTGLTNSNPCSSDCGESSEESEYDAQIAQLVEEIKSVKASIKESEECSRQLVNQKATIRSLTEQRDSLEKEKEKAVLQAKLDKQMKDLSQINQMSRALKTKFSELKRTQKMIKQKLKGTKTSLSELDGPVDITTSDIHESAAALVADVNAMHDAQSAVLHISHAANSKEVKSDLQTTDQIALAPKKGSEHSSSSSSSSKS